MKIDGIITDKFSNEYPIQLDTYTLLAINYSSNIAETVSNLDAFASNLKGQVKLCLKELPKFDEVFESFVTIKCPMFRADKNLDICLSLFYNPYFEDLYTKVKNEITCIPKKHLKYLVKNCLQVLSSAIYYNVVFKSDIYNNNSIRNYFIEKDIFNKSKELLNLINSNKQT